MEFVLLIIKWFLSMLFRVRIKGFENLDFSKPVIIMPNHTSLLDAVMLAIYLPKDVTFVVNTAIALRFSWLMRYRSHITIDPMNPYSIRQIVRIVIQKKPLVIFPEGRITTTGGLMKIYLGIGFLAMRTGAQVYPLILRGLERSKFSYLGDKIKTYWFPQVNITVGIPFTIIRDDTRSLKANKQKAAEQIYRILQQEWLDTRLKTKVNLYNELLDASQLYGSKLPIAEDLTQHVTYRQLILSCAVLSSKLETLLRNQATVGILLPNSIGHAVALFALFRAELRPAILNFSQGSQTMLECCETAGIQTILTSKVFVEKGKLEELITFLTSSGLQVVYLEDVKSRITAWDKIQGLLTYNKPAGTKNNEMILFTSGSESKPKGVVLSHENIYSNIQQVLCAIDITSKDKIFNALPMFHSFGLTAGTLLPILSGVPTYLYPTPLHYKVIPELCYDSNATILFGTSTFLAGYGRFAHPYDFYSVRYAFAGAEKLKEEVRQLWMDKFGIRILEGYGATETAPILALNTPMVNKKGTVGQFIPGIRVRIDTVEGITDGGRLLVQGPNLMKGYMIHGKGFVPAEEWYDTGDIVKQDKEGFLIIVSRLKRFAKVGGEMVSLQQIEELAAACYGHLELAAVPLVDKRKGERIFLYTTHEEDQLEQLRLFLSRHGYSPLLSPFKVEYIKHLPLLGSGKTDYVALKQMVEMKTGRGVE